MKALIIVDVQNDFCPGGTLAVKDGDKIIGRINQLVAKYKTSGNLVTYTYDDHPANHSSFKDNGGIWPAHCVKFTDGVLFHPRLLIDSQAATFSKGFEVSQDSYSGFGGVYCGSSLVEYLKEHKISEVLVVGLALDYCVKATALDALKYGFATTVDLNATKAVNVNAGDSVKALKELKQAGVRIIGD